MAVRELRVAVTAEDYDEALAFYRDVLGLPSAPPSAPRTDASRSSTPAERRSSSSPRYVDRSRWGGASQAHPIALEVDDSEATTARLPAGATVLAEPTRTPWNSLNARLEAPAGLQLTLFEELGEPARLRVPALLRDDPRFRRFWAGQSISLLGDQVSLIALRSSPSSFSTRTRRRWATSSPPSCSRTCFLLHAGAWSDRRARKRQTMIATDLGRSLLIGSIPVAYAFDALTFPHLLVVAFLMGTLSVFHVSYSAFYPALVPRERLVEGGSIMHGSRALLRRRPEHRRPAGAGDLGPVTLVVDACSYVVPALFLRRVEVDEPATEPPGVTSSPACAGPRSSGRARRDRDDQLLQLRLLRALHPLRDDGARRHARSARPRARRRRRADGCARHQSRGPEDRDRPAFAVGCVLFRRRFSWFRSPRGRSR